MSRSQAKKKENIKDILPNLIGQGEYGCVYRPSIGCSDPTQLESHKHVTKIMQERYAKYELDQYNRIHKMGNIEKFPALSAGEPKLCKQPKITVAMLRQTGCQIRGVRDSSSIFRNSDRVQLNAITYEYVGIPLNDSNPIAEKEFMRELLPVIRGLQSINRMGIFHCDLKDNNITVDEFGKLHVIDWGLAGTIYESVTSIPASYYYSFWPWDRLLIMSPQEERKIGKSLFERERLIYNRLDIYLNHKYPTDINNRLKEQYEISHIIDYYGINNILEQTLKTIDSYCLGNTLRGLHVYSTKYSWPDWSDNMETMINGMISFNPINRWTWTRVIKHIEHCLDMHVEFDRDTKTTKPTSHVFPKTLHPRKLISNDFSA